MKEYSIKIGDKFTDRAGAVIEITGEFLNGNFKTLIYRGRRRPVSGSVPAWAVQNNLAGGYWTVL